MLRARRSMRPWSIAILGVLCALDLPAAAAGDRPERWRVVNERASPPAPISGATIIVIYDGHSASPGHSQRICDRTEVVRADEQGWFNVPAPRRNRAPLVIAHKLGHANPDALIADEEKKQAYLIPNPTREERMIHLRHLRSAFRCRSSGPAAAAVVAVLDELIEEMRSVVVTPQEKQMLVELAGSRESHRTAAQLAR